MAFFSATEPIASTWFKHLAKESFHRQTRQDFYVIFFQNNQEGYESEKITEYNNIFLNSRKSPFVKCRERGLSFYL